MSVANLEAIRSQNSSLEQPGGVPSIADSYGAARQPILRLLWREWRVLRWWLVAALALTSTIMVLYTVFLSSPERLSYPDLMTLLYAQALFAPGAFLIGALSSSFAQDRDDISFQWCTSLPIHWAQSIIVKLGSAGAGALACWLTSLIFASLIGEAIRPIGLIERGAVVSPIYAMLAGIISVVFTLFFLIYSVSLIGIQICRQATNGVFLAIGLSIVVIFLSYFGFAQNFDQYGPPGSSFTVAVAAVFSYPLIIGGLFLGIACYLYRWRWYTGMYSNVVSLNFLASQPESINSADAWSMSWRVPNQQQALFWLAWRKAMQAWLWVPLMVAVILAGPLMGVLPVDGWSVLGPLGLLMLVSSIGLGSVWSLFGERGGDAESFLAERGLSPSRNWWSRYLVSTVGGTLVFLGAMFLIHITDMIARGDSVVFVPPTEQRPVWTLLIVGAHAFLGVCLLAGQIFRHWQLAAIAVAFGAIVFAVLLGMAIVTSGTFGGLVCFGLVLTALPLSWWLSTRAVVCWQPNLAWVYPVFATVVLIGSVVMMPLARVWILPSAAKELATARDLPSFNIPDLPPHTIQPPMSREILHKRIDVRSLFANANTEELRSATEAMRPQLQQYLEQAQNSSIPMIDAEYSDVINAEKYFSSLGQLGFTALEIGDVETAEVALKLRLKILTDLRPIASIGEFDQLQSEFLEALAANASPNALKRLKKLLDQDPSLLADDRESALETWASSMKAQASFLYRKYAGDATSKDSQSGQLPEPLSPSDAWLAKTRLGTSSNQASVVQSDELPFELWGDFEDERFRREIGHVYRDFQRYLRTGEVAQRLSERKLDFGRPSFDDKLSWQVVNWDRQWQALARLEARMKDVD